MRKEDEMKKRVVKCRRKHKKSKISLEIAKSEKKKSINQIWLRVWTASKREHSVIIGLGKLSS